MSRLPSADAYLSHPSKGVTPWQVYSGGFGHVVFTERLRDVGWYPGPGVGSSFGLDLPIDTIKDVAHVFDALDEVGWLSHAGRFCIQQSNDYWYGAGARECWKALQSPEPRYEAAKGPFHHTEEVTYVDSFTDGFYVLSIDVCIGNPLGIGHAEISGQLYGVPADTAEFQHLLRLLQLDGQLYFRSLERSPVRTIWRWKGRPIPLKPVSFLRAVKDDWVCGIVARNPFHKGRHLDQVSSETAEYLYGLQDIEVVPFRLGQWHEVGDGMNYYLRGLEATSTSDALVFSLIANSVPRGKSASTRGSKNRATQRSSTLVLFLGDWESPCLAPRPGRTQYRACV